MRGRSSVLRLFPTLSAWSRGRESERSFRVGRLAQIEWVAGCVPWGTRSVRGREGGCWERGADPAPGSRGGARVGVLRRRTTHSLQALAFVQLSGPRRGSTWARSQRTVEHRHASRQWTVGLGARRLAGRAAADGDGAVSLTGPICPVRPAGRSTRRRAVPGVEPGPWLRAVRGRPGWSSRWCARGSRAVEGGERDRLRGHSPPRRSNHPGGRGCRAPRGTGDSFLGRAPDAAGAVEGPPRGKGASPCRNHPDLSHRGSAGSRVSSRGGGARVVPGPPVGAAARVRRPPFTARREVRAGGRARLTRRGPPSPRFAAGAGPAVSRRRAASGRRCRRAGWPPRTPHRLACRVEPGHAGLHRFGHPHPPMW